MSYLLRQYRKDGPLSNAPLRAVAAIEILSQSKKGLSLTKLADSLQLAPQTLQSILRTLEHHGWVVQSMPRGPYRLGPGISEIHRNWRAGKDRISLSRSIVVDLCRLVEEYVILTEWSDGGMMMLLETHPDRELVVRSELCLPERLHTMATGKLLLSLIEERQRNAIVSTLPLPHCGLNSVTDRGVFLKQLDSIREAEVAVCIDEAAQGIIGIAVPVVTFNDHCSSALGISLPMARYSKARLTELIANLRDTSNAITQAWE